MDLTRAVEIFTTEDSLGSNADKLAVKSEVDLKLNGEKFKFLVHPDNRHVKRCKRTQGSQIAIAPRRSRNGPFKHDNGHPPQPYPATSTTCPVLAPGPGRLCGLLTPTYSILRLNTFLTLFYSDTGYSCSLNVGILGFLGAKKSQSRSGLALL